MGVYQSSAGTLHVSMCLSPAPSHTSLTTSAFSPDQNVSSHRAFALAVPRAQKFRLPPSLANAHWPPITAQAPLLEGPSLTPQSSCLHSSLSPDLTHSLQITLLICNCAFITMPPVAGGLRSRAPASRTLARTCWDAPRCSQALAQWWL